MNEAIAIVAREFWRILQFILGAFAHTWPLWVVSIPLAAAVKMSGLSARLGGLISMRPISAVLFATLVGAVSPLCSCSVIPVIFSLLSAGVPLAPVMSFWLASPSMDPEIFLLSVSTLGWPLAIARLAATTIMSLGGGFLVILLERRGFFAGGVLKEAKSVAAESVCACGKGKPRKEGSAAAPRFTARGPGSPAIGPLPLAGAGKPVAGCACAAPAASVAPSSCCASSRPAAAAAVAEVPEGKGEARRDFASRFGKELLASFAFVAKFMAIAFALEALIKFYLPEAWVKTALGAQNAFAVPIAVLVGIPFYTTNAQALGMIGGLLGKGMSQAAALSFLIGGATTTLPAMSAVYGIAKPRVFAVYLGSAVLFSLAAGLLWSILPF